MAKMTDLIGRRIQAVNTDTGELMALCGTVQMIDGELFAAWDNWQSNQLVREGFRWLK